jgi:hypothetical protein
MKSPIRLRAVSFGFIALMGFGAMPSVGLANGENNDNGSGECTQPGEIIFLSGLVLQGGDTDFYLWSDKPVCVAAESSAGEQSPVRTRLVSLRCYDDSWNGREKKRGETIEFRGEIYAGELGNLYLSCHMPL